VHNERSRKEKRGYSIRVKFRLLLLIIINATYLCQYVRIRTFITLGVVGELRTLNDKNIYTSLYDLRFSRRWL
jgi:hypothetical protein